MKPTAKKLTKTDLRLIKRALEIYAVRLSETPMVKNGRMTANAKKVNQALLIARWKLAKV